VRLEGLSQVRDVAAYWPSTAQGKGVALLQDGSVVWFKIALDIRDDALRNLPVTRVTRIAKARAVAAGAWGVGVVDADGKVWVWGSNPEVSTDNRHSMPGFRGGAPYGLNDDDPTMVPGLSEVVDIDFSDAFAGALRSDGTVWVWNDKAPMKIFDDVRLVP
jgi:alpha-tubulin suppressor-like RCC1 family protein